jgi:hypothetical protein
VVKNQTNWHPDSGIAVDASQCQQDFARLGGANSPKLTVYAADLAQY